MKKDFHIDMSNRIYKKKTIGIACVSADKKEHIGCALKGNLIKKIEAELYTSKVDEESAKLYAVCIYFLINNRLKDIETLIICLDEKFDYVKKFLVKLLGADSSRINIISIIELRKKIGKKIGSLADNMAECYRKRALKPTRWEDGKNLNIVEVDYSMIEEQWERLK
ncbi:MAG: hypothetical protein Q7R87_02260 [Nanoarchaeota archaeon]|nr:hypothetical protein [Nanoarchaeota archaeon]